MSAIHAPTSAPLKMANAATRRAGRLSQTRMGPSAGGRRPVHAGTVPVAHGRSVSRRGSRAGETDVSG